MTYPTTRTATVAQYSDFSNLTDLFTNLIAGDACYLPNGTIADSGSYTRSAPMSLKGAGIYGINGTLISYTGSGVFLTLGTSGNGTVLEDFRVAGGASLQKLVFINGINGQINLNRLFLEGNNSGNGIALSIQDSWDINITNGTYRYCATGIHANNSGTYKVANNLNIRDNNLQSNSSGVRWDTGAGGNIEGNDFSGCALAIDLGNGIGSGEFLEGINIGSNYHEGGTYARIGYNANANSNVRSINIHGGYLDCTDDYIQLYTCNRVTISGVRFGSLSAGKKHIVIDANAQNTYIDVPELDPANVTDNSSSTIYAPHLMSALEVSLTSNQTVADNTYVTVAFNSVDRSRYITWDSTNKRATPLRKGWYKVEAHASIGAMADGKNVFLGIFKNGVRVGGDDMYSSATNSYPSLIAPKTLYFNGTTDYVDARVVQNSGGGVSKSLTGDPAFTYMSITPA